jgi:glyoxylase-like metal-dependent hydrolase (beta-lactamase superfamily II)
VSDKTDPVYPDLDPPATGDGSVCAIAPGVGWLRMPLNGRIEHINVWALADGDGWVVVDTGLRTPETGQAWRQAFAETLIGGVRRVIVTHLHPDHAGMAGWLGQMHQAPLAMSALEYYQLRALCEDSAKQAPAEAIAFFRAAGWDEAQIDHYRARFGLLGKYIYPLPSSFEALRAGARLRIGDKVWQVLVGRGHSPEHVLLYDPQDRLLISGDQVLPTISSNVSVFPQQPEGDPLTDWLETLGEIRQTVPDDVLVLPSHGKPFRGLHARIADLINGHEAGLQRLLSRLDTPQRAVDVFPALFRRPITEPLLGLATGESLAHLACLRSRGLADCRKDDQGVNWWQALAQ